LIGLWYVVAPSRRSAVFQVETQLRSGSIGLTQSLSYARREAEMCGQSVFQVSVLLSEVGSERTEEESKCQ
jgi:hypothetical protein